MKILSHFSLPVVLAVILAGCNTPEFITYEQYGAVGDGVHDDQAAIIAAHAAANEKHLPVKAKDGATYLIGPGSEIAEIKTDVDFGTARFLIDDVRLEKYTAPLFLVGSYQEPYAVEGVTSLKKGQENLGVGLPCRSLVEITNDSRRVYIRRGANQDNGTSQKEMIVVDKDGTIDPSAPVVWDYDTLASGKEAMEGRLGVGGFASAVKAWPIDSEKLTIKGGTFITVANKAESRYNYHGRNIIVNRSNVLVEGLCHYVVGEEDHGAPYSGFISINHAADVTVSDCLLTPHKTYRTIGSAGVPVSMGSYDIEAQFCVGLHVRNLRQTINIDDSAHWGLFASNFCKDIRMDNCVISRFDAHMGVCNVTLTGCKFGYMGVQCVGFGKALVQDCEIHRNTLIWLREDYGSSWDGDIIIRNCKLVLPPGSSSAYVVSGSNDGLHDFGYGCTLPECLEVDGLEIDDSAAGERYTGPAVYNSFSRDVSAEGLLPFPADGTIILKNISTASGKKLIISPNEAMFAETDIK